jgi:hypothetical protein
VADRYKKSPLPSVCSSKFFVFSRASGDGASDAVGADFGRGRTPFPNRGAGARPFFVAIALSSEDDIQ